MKFQQYIMPVNLGEIEEKIGKMAKRQGTVKPDRTDFFPSNCECIDFLGRFLIGKSFFTYAMNAAYNLYDRLLPGYKMEANLDDIEFSGERTCIHTSDQDMELNFDDLEITFSIPFSRCALYNRQLVTFLFEFVNGSHLVLHSIAIDHS